MLRIAGATPRSSRLASSNVLARKRCVSLAALKSTRYIPMGSSVDGTSSAGSVNVVHTIRNPSVPSFFFPPFPQSLSRSLSSLSCSHEQRQMYGRGYEMYEVGRRQFSSNKNHRRGPRDPRVAKWIATNRQILDCHSGSEVLSVLSSTPDALTKMAGGGALSVVNIATSIHRISRSASTDRRERQAILSDPRYALLLCSATEALIGMDCSKPLSTLKDDTINNSNSPVTFNFSPRELANIAWALAKMEILPPASSCPFYRDTTGSHHDMRLRCFELRSSVL